MIDLYQLNCYYSKSTGDTFMQMGAIRTDDDSVLIGPTKHNSCIPAMTKAQLTEYIAVLNKILGEKGE
jgi:hypothetical protein